MNYYKNIKELLINNEINKKVKIYSINRNDLKTYYDVGKLLNDAGKHYGEKIISNYSKRLTLELGKKYSITSLKYMRLFYNFSKSHSVSDQLSYTHYKTLLTVKDFNKVEYYIMISIHQNLSVRQLQEKIKNKEYERLPKITKNKLINNKESKIIDFVKNPVIIKNNNNYEEFSEKTLQKFILEDIPSFLEELGEGFTFIKNEYKIKIGNRNNYIDLLLYNIKYRCYVVVELKISELKKEHIGQIQVYMNYIDKNIKTINESKTVGMIICKYNNDYIIKYCSNKRIISREYILL